MEPIVDGLEQQYLNEVKLLKLNAGTDGSATFQHYHLRGHPGYLLFNPAGEVLWSGVGELEAGQIKSEIESYLLQIDGSLPGGWMIDSTPPAGNQWRIDYLLEDVFMRRLLIVVILAGVVVAACAPVFGQEAAESRFVTIYKMPTWGCCGDWAEYLEGYGFTLETKDLESLDQIKSEYHVPIELQSCHTAIVDGYVIEGHVPVNEIERLLEERPEVVGIGVAGMPAGSPGMEIEGFEDEPFDVVTFDETGILEIFARYE